MKLCRHCLQFFPVNHERNAILHSNRSDAISLNRILGHFTGDIDRHTKYFKTKFLAKEAALLREKEFFKDSDSELGFSIRVFTLSEKEYDGFRCDRITNVQNLNLKSDPLQSSDPTRQTNPVPSIQNTASQMLYRSFQIWSMLT